MISLWHGFENFSKLSWRCACQSSGGVPLEPPGHSPQVSRGPQGQAMSKSITSSWLRGMMLPLPAAAAGPSCQAATAPMERGDSETMSTLPCGCLATPTMQLRQLNSRPLTDTPNILSKSARAGPQHSPQSQEWSWWPYGCCSGHFVIGSQSW